MKWCESFSIGFPEVDSQHKQLIEKVDGLENQLMNGCVDDNSFANTFLFVVDYARSHFTDEEDMMLEIGYPEFEEHRQMHDQLINHLAIFLKDMQSGNGGTFSELISYLHIWIEAHILTEDRKIGEFLRQTMK